MLLRVINLTAPDRRLGLESSYKTGDQILKTNIKQETGGKYSRNLKTKGQDGKGYILFSFGRGGGYSLRPGEMNNWEGEN